MQPEGRFEAFLLKDDASVQMIQTPSCSSHKLGQLPSVVLALSIDTVQAILAFN